MIGALRSIRGRLWSGFGLLVAMMLVGGVLSRSSMISVTERITVTMAEVRTEAALTSELSARVAQTIEAAARFLDSRDPQARAAFQEAGWKAHDVQRRMNAAEGRSAIEVATIARIETSLSNMEVRYAAAHRLADLGRSDEARREAARARASVDTLLAAMELLGAQKAAAVELASTRLTDESERRSLLVLVMMGVAALAGIVAVVVTVRSIARPLNALVRQARAMSRGELGSRVTGELPGEFHILAETMNQTAESLSRVVSVAAQTADDVATSAHELASVSEQISLSAGQMATAMTDVSHGAEHQVSQLREIDEALQAIRQAAVGVRRSAAEVGELTRGIEGTAQAKRIEVDRVGGILVDVKRAVEHAAIEVTALHQTLGDINKFVLSVGQIADQTNLLALNAAIEAARAGEAGRGFAVVADEVRVLAEQSQRAADDIVRLTGNVTARATAGATAMQASAARVAEIETVSRELDDALRTIVTAAERAHRAAAGVTDAAEANEHAAIAASSGIAAISRTAESHAAAAEQINASTQEQSAACQEMSSASNVLLTGSTQLRELVGSLAVA